MDDSDPRCVWEREREKETKWVCECANKREKEWGRKSETENHI